MRQQDILAFTLGAIAGAAVGLLLAPQSGKSTIDRLVNRIKKQPVTNELSNRNLYALSDISQDAAELAKLKSR
ncbi:MAG TPA: YtxH domain-containing protein [Cytophagales bacterium]|nr:YtxH domain-containing protein [Cytophagales bacterium]